MRGGSLVETEIGLAKQERRAGVDVLAVPGANSPVDTDQTRPAFLIHCDKRYAARLQLYSMEVTDRGRQVVSPRKARPGSRPWSQRCRGI